LYGSVIMLTEALIQEALTFLRGRIRRTPIELSPQLSAIVGVPVWLKLEFLQTTGSFKLRGALFRMSKLTEKERQAGFVTSSAGNHGKAVAYAAKQMGIHIVVCVSSSVDEAKYRGIVELGADVRLSPFLVTTKPRTGGWLKPNGKGSRFSRRMTMMRFLLRAVGRWPQRFSKTRRARGRSLFRLEGAVWQPASRFTR
jgi:predicted alternative tryptophan synthase beta-subunit